MDDENLQGFVNFYDSKNQILFCISLLKIRESTKEEYKEMIKKEMKRLYEELVEEKNKIGKKPLVLNMIERACEDTEAIRLQVRSAKEIKLIKWYKEAI